MKIFERKITFHIKYDYLIANSIRSELLQFTDNETRLFFQGINLTVQSPKIMFNLTNHFSYDARKIFTFTSLTESFPFKEVLYENQRLPLLTQQNNNTLMKKVSNKIISSRLVKRTVSSRKLLRNLFQLKLGEKKNVILEILFLPVIYEEKKENIIRSLSFLRTMAQSFRVHPKFYECSKTDVKKVKKKGKKNNNIHFTFHAHSQALNENSIESGKKQ